MKLVRPDFAVASQRPETLAGLAQLYVAASLRAVVHHDIARDDADHLRAPVVPRETAREIHQPAALGVGRQSVFYRRADVAAQRGVGFECLHVHLGETAAQEQRIDIRQARILKRVERDELGVGGAQRLKIAGIIKRKRGIARDADAHVGLHGYRTDRRARRNISQGGRRGSDCQQAVDIHLRGDVRGDGADLGVRRRGFVARYQSEMALDDGEGIVVMHGAEHRDVGVMFDHGAQFGFVTRAAELIQNYAGDADIAIECLVAEDQRGDAACHAAGVDDQHHRRGQ